METTDFELGAATGIFVGESIIASALGVALMATPVGWVLVTGVVYDRDTSWIPF